LHSKGVECFRSAKGVCFKSPFRTDSNPSATIFANTKIFYDIGTGERMNLLNFIMKLENCNFDAAFQIVSNHITPEPQRSAPDTNTAQAAQYVYRQLQNRNLIQYAQQRGISEPTAKNYLSECWQDGKYYYLAFRNDKGGHVLRNGTKSGYSKSNAKGEPTGVTTIDNQSDRVVIFEGFFDFLSWVEYMTANGKQARHFNAIVLNSCVNVSYILNALGAYAHIYLLLDNDPKGNDTAAKILNRYPDTAQNLTPRLLTDGSKDFNDYWKTLITK
jgi:hypothetical protein